MRSPNSTSDALLQLSVDARQTLSDALDRGVSADEALRQQEQTEPDLLGVRSILSEGAWSNHQATYLLRSLLGVLKKRDTAASLTWTGPPLAGLLIPHTQDTIKKLVSVAKRKIVVAAYSVRVSTLEDLGLLAVAAKIPVFVIVDAGATENYDVGLMRDMGIRVSSVRRADRPEAKFHVKAIVIDDEIALVTSANFSHLGQLENIELGVVLEGPLAAQVSQLLSAFVARYKNQESE